MGPLGHRRDRESPGKRSWEWGDVRWVGRPESVVEA